MTQPKYCLIAGVNGAGKSSLYSLQPGIVKGTRRINADEILRQNHGDWHRQMDSFRAMRTELTEIRVALANQESIHVETTLAGNGKTHLELIAKAKSKGYEVDLIYVTLDQVQTAISRVQDRVSKGGHGIAPELITKRFRQSLLNLPIIAAQCDEIMIYDNTKRLTLVYDQLKQNVAYNRLIEYPWLYHLDSQIPF